MQQRARLRPPVLLFVLGAVVSIGLPWRALAATSADSGLPVPRFVTLKAAEANMRTGPGTRYPIKWTYQRSGLPLEVTAEFDQWRRVRDWQGTEGWMHHAMLSSKRSFMLKEKSGDLRAEPNSTSGVVARLEGQVIGRLLLCPKDVAWCRVEVEDVRGWLQRDQIWGVNATEEVQ